VLTGCCPVGGLWVACWCAQPGAVLELLPQWEAPDWWQLRQPVCWWGGAKVAMVHNLVLCLSAAEAGARLAVWCPNLAQFLRA
jgi:hypothetical protein